MPSLAGSWRRPLLVGSLSPVTKLLPGRSLVLLTFVAFGFASCLTGCELFVHFDRTLISADAGTDALAMDASGDGGVDGGRDVGTLDDTGIDAGDVDAFVGDDADIDAAVEDTGIDAFVPEDAFVPIDVGTDVGIDAFVPIDVGTDAFVDPCTNGTQDGTETDIDCGGTCATNCANGDMCLVGGDCVSAFCNASMVCAASTCTDLMRGPGETDIDCGGSVCPSCADGLMCLINADCMAPSVCTLSVCGP